MAELNMKWCKQEAFYSDGSVEDEILDMLRNGDDPARLLEKDDRWPILYHFSRERRNLLEWFSFRKEAALLEIGAGCGALTGLLCEKVSHVCAVELSERRSRIVYHRHEQAENLEVVAGNFMEIDFSRQFDYATLIGVLEYAECSAVPPTAILGKARELLKLGGSLILAIENKFGLKYFAGARDDHTGRSFDGIEGYPSGAIATYSKPELRSLLEEAGFEIIKFYYPYPDYKLPREVFSDDCLPGNSHILHDAPNFDQERLDLFSEKKAFVNIIRSGLFDLFANSFLVIASTRVG